MMKLVVGALALLSMAEAVHAAEVPSTAKLLTKAEIVAAYDGKTYTWTHPTGDMGTGTTTWNVKAGTIGGKYHVGGATGEWDGKISWKKDQFCFRTRGNGKGKYGPVTCNLVYADGTTFYEVDPATKAVNSINTP